MSRKIKYDHMIEAMVLTGMFRVRRDGRIETCYQWRATAAYIVPWYVCDRLDGKGYRYVSYRMCRVKAHRLAYALYHKVSLCGLEINHIDGNKLNNRKSNLELCDARRQSEHAFIIGLNHAKLTALQVREIRARHAGGETMASLAREFNVCQPNVRSIVNRKTWKHVT